MFFFLKFLWRWGLGPSEPQSLQRFASYPGSAHCSEASPPNGTAAAGAKIEIWVLKMGKLKNTGS